jgi:hypothetical protein
MSESRIGRIVVASLHEALADQLPLRLDFYESYLPPMGMRSGRIGVASFTAALSFLRFEEGAYDAVVRQAGRFAAEWSLDEVSPMRRAFWMQLPARQRQRRGMSLTARLADQTVRTARGHVTRPWRQPLLTITGSPFCELRQRSAAPLCGFYAAAMERFCELLGIPVAARITACRAVGADRCQVAAEPVSGAAHAETRSDRVLT